MNTIGRIQTLCENDEDIIEVDGVLTDDVNSRQYALSTASKIAQNGKLIAKRNDSFISCDSARFVLETPLIELDSAGRPIPVGFCGLRKGFDKSATSDEVKSFVRRSGRSLSPESISDMNFCLNALSISNRLRKQKIILLSIVGLSLFLILSILMLRR